MLSSLLSTLTLATAATAKILYAGVSESSGEFGVYSATSTPGTGLPGRFGVDYAFINKTAVDILVSEGANVFRVAFLLERMCPLQYGLGNKFNETHWGFYQDAINYITNTKGAYAILDPHNYDRYGDPSHQPTSGPVIGDTSNPKAATTAQFKAFWQELAGRFKNNQKVIFGIMNEPHDMATSLVLQNDQAAIDGIRASGAKQLILAPGNGYTGGHAWTQSSQGDEPSSNYMYKLTDPHKNLAMDIHEYLDVDFSGQHIVCSQAFPTNMQPLTDWLHHYNFKAFVSEIGGSNSTGCAGYLETALQYMQDNSDVYVGWAAWAAGPLWGVNSPCCNDGNQWGSLEPGSRAADGGPSYYETVWLKTIQPRIPKTLKKNGIANLQG